MLRRYQDTLSWSRETVGRLIGRLKPEPEVVPALTRYASLDAIKRKFL